MSGLKVKRKSIRNGRYEGILNGHSNGTKAPIVELRFLGRSVAAAEVSLAGKGEWTVKVQIPTTAVSEGVQVFALVEAETGALLDVFAVACGDAANDDLRVQIRMLQEELEMVKSALFRLAR